MAPADRTSTRLSRQRGLTLVELALVAGMLGVLLMLGFSGWQTWRNKVLTKEAQDMIIGMAATIDAYYTDTGNLPADLAAVGFGGATDPWDHAYVYRPLSTPQSKGKARKDHSLVPLNSDYDLYSKGPDGESAAPLTAKSSRDDILRANNGRFVGPAYLY